MALVVPGLAGHDAAAVGSGVAVTVMFATGVALADRTTPVRTGRGSSSTSCRSGGGAAVPIQSTGCGSSGHWLAQGEPGGETILKVYSRPMLESPGIKDRFTLPSASV